VRIAIATWTRRAVGGVETYLGDLVPALAAAGHHLAFWCEIDRPVDRPPIAMPHGTPVYCAETDGRAVAIAHLRAWAPEVLFAHDLQDPSTERQLLEVAPGVCLAHNYHGTCVGGSKTFKSPGIVPCSRRFGWPCLLHYYPRRCGGWSPTTMWREFRRQADRLDALSGYRCIVTLSSHMREEYVRHGFDARQVYALHGEPPAPEPPAQADPVEAHEGGHGQPWRLLFAGRMDELKGGGYLLDALPEVVCALGVPIHVTMAGDGPSRERWQRRAAAHQARDARLRVEFPGWLDREGIEERLGRSDLLVLPSLWPEPFGLVGLEAIRRAVPVAAFAVGGVPDWLRPGVNGHLADGNPPRPRGLAAAIVACLKDRRTHAALRQGASRTAVDRAFHDHVGVLTRLFEQIVGEEPRRTQ